MLNRDVDVIAMPLLSDEREQNIEIAAIYSVNRSSTVHKFKLENNIM